MIGGKIRQPKKILSTLENACDEALLIGKTFCIQLFSCYFSLPTKIHIFSIIKTTTAENCNKIINDARAFFHTFISTQNRML